MYGSPAAVSPGSLRRHMPFATTSTVPPSAIDAVEEAVSDILTESEVERSAAVTEASRLKAQVSHLRAQISVLASPTRYSAYGSPHSDRGMSPVFSSTAADGDAVLQLKQQVKLVSSHRDKLLRQVEQHAGLQSRCATLEEIAGTMQEAWDADVVKVQKLNRSAAGLRSDVSNLRSTLSSAQSDHATDMKRVSEAVGAMSKLLQQREGEVAALTSQLKVAQDTSKGLAASVKGMAAERGSLLERTRSAEQGMSGVTQALERSQGDNASLLRQLDDVTADVKAACEREETERRRAVEATRLCDQYKKELEAASDYAAAAREAQLQTADKAATDLDSLRHECSQLKREAATANATAATLSADLDACQSRLQAALKAAEDVQHQLVTRQTRHAEELRALNADLESERRKATQAVARCEATEAAHAVSGSTTDSELVRLRSELDQQTASTVTQSRELRFARDEVSRLRTRYDVDMAEVKRAHAAELASLAEKYEADIRQLKRSHRRTLDEASRLSHSLVTATKKSIARSMTPAASATSRRFLSRSAPTTPVRGPPPAHGRPTPGTPGSTVVFQTPDRRPPATPDGGPDSSPIHPSATSPRYVAVQWPGSTPPYRPLRGTP